jgi:hypothetical protein
VEAAAGEDVSCVQKKKMKSGNEIKFICFLSFLFADQTLREAGNN